MEDPTSRFYLNLLLTVLVVVGFEVLRRLSFRLASRKDASIQSKLALKQVLTIVFYLITIVSIVLIWFKRFDYFFASIGLVAVGLTVVNKEVILNFVASWIILWRNLFSVGDRIQIGVFAGDVTGKGIFYFTLLEVGSSDTGEMATGKIVRVPNSMVLTTPVVNATKDFPYVWNTIDCTLAKESDWEHCRDMALNALHEYAASAGIDYGQVLKDLQDKFIIFKRLGPQVYVKMLNGEIVLTLRYLCEPHKHRESENFLWERLLTLNSTDSQFKLAPKC